MIKRATGLGTFAFVGTFTLVVCFDFRVASFIMPLAGVELLSSSFIRFKVLSLSHQNGINASMNS